ncbi:MAG: MFS transporter [Polyangiaceae bacterium]
MSNRESTSRVVLVNTLAFAVSFAVWVLLGPSTRLIAKELAIDPATAAAVKAAPILVGSVMRIPVGMITDRLGARLTFPLVQLVGLAGVLVLSFAHGLTLLVVGGLVLGMVGTTFVVGVQSVSSWVPAERHGFALGIFGAGNVGTALTTLCLPFLNAAFGWRTSLRVSSLALLVSALAYYAVIRNANASGEEEPRGALGAPLEPPRPPLRLVLHGVVRCVRRDHADRVRPLHRRLRRESQERGSLGDDLCGGGEPGPDLGR